MDLIATLQAHDIQPSVQRVAVARYVLQTHEHPSADLVWTRVKADLPVISRATVYNTLHLFAEKGLVRELALAENCVVFDPKMEPHHHFVDDDTGAISDIPWEALRVKGVDALEGFAVREHQVVLRGKTKRTRSAQRKSTRRI